MPKITVVAKLTAKPEAVEQVKNEMLKMIAPTRCEHGCLEYRLHQDVQAPAVFFFYENWADMAALDRHLGSPHYRQYAEAVGGLLAEKLVHKLLEMTA